MTQEQSQKSPRRGYFISVEGIEGAGKSSAMSAIEDQIRAAGMEVLITREPGGTPLGEAVRGLLLDPAHKGMSGLAELLLMFAARAQHLEQVILPALAAGTWVVSDRFTDASYAYQGGGREMGSQVVSQLETLVQGELRPNLTLVLDVPPDLGLARARRVSEPDRFELEREAFFARVRDAYLERAKAAPNRYRVIDARAEQAEVLEQVSKVLKGVLGGV